jgi:hypothetical protein
MTDRFVVLGLAGSRATWFAEVGRWAHAGSMPIEFVKCVSVEQLRTRIRSGRPHSAAVLDGDAAGVDRDLLHDLHDAGVAALMIDGRRDAAHWAALGADAVLDPGFGPDALVDVLRKHAALVPTTEWSRASASGDPSPAGGRLVAMCGSGGVGTSTLAIALAQQRASRRKVVLADLCLRAEQGMLHDAGDVGPGVQELVDQSRTSQPGVDHVRAATYAVDQRGYALLLGLRDAAAWSSLRPRAIATALGGLRTAFDEVVCDCDADLEGHAGGGSWDVEERNALARTAVATADVVVVVGVPGLKGIYSMGRLIGDVLGLGVVPERCVPVINRAPRGSRANRRMTDALVSLVPGGQRLASPVFVPERDVEVALHDLRRLPAALGDSVAAAIDRAAATHVAMESAEPAVAARRIVPGELASITGDLATP